MTLPREAEDRLREFVVRITYHALHTAKQTGRPCRLREDGAVSAFLRALWRGTSHRQACKRSGLTDTGVRRWLEDADKPDAPLVYREFRAAFDWVMLSRPPRVVPVGVAPIFTQSAEPSDSPAFSDSPVPVPAPAPVRAVPAPAPPPVVRPVPPSLVAKWEAMLSRAEAMVRHDPAAGWMEARAIKDAVVRQMSAYGVQTVPAMPPPPAGLSYSEIIRQYCAWCARHGQPIPSELQADLLARRWYDRERQQAECPASVNLASV